MSKHVKCDLCKREIFTDEEFSCPTITFERPTVSVIAERHSFDVCVNCWKEQLGKVIQKDEGIVELPNGS